MNDDQSSSNEPLSNPFVEQTAPRTEFDPTNPYAATTAVSETDGYESDVEQYRRRYLAHEASIKSVGILFFIVGAMMIVFGVILIGTLFDAPSDEDLLFITITLAMLFLIGGSQLYASYGIRRLHQTARTIVAVYCGIGLLGFPFYTMICGWILYCLFGRKGRVVFSAEYKEAIRRTPDIKYQSSMVVKFFAALLGIVVLAGMVVSLFVGF